MRIRPEDNPTGPSPHRPESRSGARVAAARRLQARLPEIEASVANRVKGISGATDVSDPNYLEGLRSTIAIAIEYAIEVLEHGERNAPPPPPALLAQARLAARSGVGLDTVLRRYLAGYTLMGDVLAREVEEGNLSGFALATLLQGWGGLLDRVLAAVSEEYLRELRLRPDSSEGRRVARVRQLLAGEPIDASDFAYDFEAHHVALVATGSAASEMAAAAAAASGSRLLQVRAGRTLWAWLGSRSRIQSSVLEDLIPISSESAAILGIGEPASGLEGWRVSHKQAVAAFSVAHRRGGGVARYGNVALLAAVMRDDLHAQSLLDLYIAPLAAERDQGVTLKETLRAYLRADQNVSSTAAALGVSRHTVRNRLSLTESLLGQPLRECVQEIGTALQLEQLPD